MDGISVSAASGMKTRMESLELLANNLANIETGGYKADREFYSLYSGFDSTPDPETGAQSTIPVIQKRWTDPAQGELNATSNPLDFAIDGDGMFAVQTPRGVRYTRNGNFRVDAQGNLVAADRSPVLAVGGGKIPIQAAVPVEVQNDGTILQAGQSVGRMVVASFADGELDKEGSNYFVPVSGAQPRSASGSVLQGKLESSNVGAPESAVRLVAIMRQFEMLQRAAGIGNEMNKRAMDEVGRVVS